MPQLPLDRLQGGLNEGVPGANQSNEVDALMQQADEESARASWA